MNTCWKPTKLTHYTTQLTTTKCNPSSTPSYTKSIITLSGKTLQTKSAHHTSTVSYAPKRETRKHSKFFYTDNWGGLSDGVHGTYDTRLKWAKCRSNSINLNRGTNSKLKHRIDMETNNKRKHSTDNISSDDEPHSPKRSWRRDRTN